MPEYLSPGVFVEEVSSGIKPIEGVGTSTGAFVGGAVKGPVNTPVLVTNVTQFVSTFGSFHPSFFLAYAVRHFFLEGGTRCYVVRAFRASAALAAPDRPVGVPQDSAFVQLVGGAAPGTPVLRVVAASPGTWGNDLTVVIGPPAFDPRDTANAQNRFSLRVQVRRPGAPTETIESFDSINLAELTADGLPNPIHAENRINGASPTIQVDDLGTTAATTPPTAGSFNLAGGANGQNLGSGDLVGLEKEGTGLWALARVDDINIVALPDLMGPGIAAAAARQGTLDALTFCERRKDCFLVADTPSGLTPEDALAYRQARMAFSGNPFNSSYGALYYPWIQVGDPVTGGLRLCPPSGAVAGSYSATDVRRGVHKAPAGVEDGYLNAAADLEQVLTTGEQDTLNPRGVNVIRKFTESGIVIWGARTLSADPEWKYVNVRRLFLFLEKSIDKGTQWVVFEPNDPVLWKRIVRNIGAFLRVQWREGKLIGLKEEEAFFVKCDAETNPPETRDLGQVHTVIGVAPSKPAEFAVFRISQYQSGANG